ncbi:hypothetical protein F5890DRAFT_1420042, partial [Lentinula detonsa]
RVAMGDVLTSCNWVIRGGAPKTAIKRVFLITDEDDPHPSSKQLRISAQKTLKDLAQVGVAVEPFFIQTEDNPSGLSKLYPVSHDDFLAESISVSRIEDLLSQMKFRESTERALFNIPFELSQGFAIGVKGSAHQSCHFVFSEHRWSYGLVTEQKKGGYKYFVDLGDRLEVAIAKMG